MKCPVCGQDCIQSSDELLKSSIHRFTSCPSCSKVSRDKRKFPDTSIPPPFCSVCGKRHLDEVFVHIWLILSDEGVISKQAPLMNAGVPHLHPFMVLRESPHLPKKSLILLTHAIDPYIAERLMNEVPELRGVVRDRHKVPGISGSYDSPKFHTHELIAGCDLHAMIYTSNGKNIVVYQQSSTMHVEMPKPFNPKLVSISHMLKRKHPKTVIDGCCGIGTLGISAAMCGTPNVIFNDRWQAATFWCGVNIEVNKSSLGVEEFIWSLDPSDFSVRKVRSCPVPVGEAVGQNTHLEVWHGDFRNLPKKIQGLETSLCIYDPFEKQDRLFVETAMKGWESDTGGQIFMP